MGVKFNGKLVTAIAYICSGDIVVMNNGEFSLNVGVYTPDEFQYADSKF